MQASRLGRYAGLLGAYLRPQWLAVVGLAVLLLGSLALQLVNPQVVRYFIDQAQGGGSDRALLLAAVAYLAAALARHLLELGAAYAGQNVAWNATNRLRQVVAAHCLRLDLAFHKRHTPGELIERIDGDITVLGNFFSEFSLRLLANGALVLGILVLLLREDRLLGLALGLYTFATVAVLGRVQGLAVRRWAAARQASADLYGFIEERIGGAEDVRAAGAVGDVIDRLFRVMRPWLERHRAAWVTGTVIQNFTNLLSVAGYGLGLALAVWLYSRGQASIGTAYLIVAYTGMLAVPLHGLRTQASDLQQSAAAIDRLLALLAEQPAVASPGTDRPLPPGPLSVALDGVTFRYETGDDVLRDVSFSVPAGQVLGVLGRTGSGKSTLARLLFRLYDPAAGTVRVGGVDLRAAALPSLRARVGLVTQEVQLFAATLRENLAFFDPARSEADLQAALRELGLWGWVEALPDGLDTRLAGSGQGLSAGEAQLLAFARVFLRQPGLIILDEASSRLDPATEARLERAVDRLLAGRTGIVIAHRLHTVRRADYLLILEDGRVAEWGPRLALEADPGSRFYRLLQTGLEEVLA